MKRQISFPSEARHSLGSSVHFFDSSMSDPALPVAAYYGVRNCHRLITDFGEGTWDIERMSKDLARILIRSDARTGHGGIGWNDAIFGTKSGIFIQFEDSFALQVYAPSRKKASLVVRRLMRYWTPKAVEEPLSGSYHLLREGSRGLRSHRVEIKPRHALSEKQLALNYGGDSFVEWHRQFVAALKDRPHGISVLDGPMGTGKSSYLRALMVELRETHKFFFLPPSAVGLLVNPALISFWENQKCLDDSKAFVLVIEDSEEVLRQREAGNTGPVSMILSLGDGLFSDWLPIQIICTINSPTKDIDPALLRPGRCITSKYFGRIGHSDAHRLAEDLGIDLPLQEDYSLAEIYALKPIGIPASEPERRIGFAA